MNTRTDSYAFDLASAVIDQDTGWLTVDGTAALVGVMAYDTGDEYVPPETLEETAADLVGMPVTIEHPASQELDSSTTRMHQVGTVISSHFDGTRLRVKLRLTDNEAIAAIQSGKRELSPGYRVAVDERNGAANGKNYKFVQVGRKYNHLALVDRARGGRAAKLDSEDRHDMEPVSTMINGVEFLVAPEVAAELERLRMLETPPAEDEADAADESPAAPSDPVKMDSAFIQTLEDRVAKRLLSEIRADRAQVEASARSLGETVARCTPHLPQSYKTDGKSEATIIGDTLIALVPDIKAQVLAVRTDAAALRGMLTGVLAAKPAAGKPSTSTANDADDSDPVEAARQKQAARRAGGTQ